MIHKTAIIDNKAKVSSSANIGPYSVIGPNVEIGEDVIIHSHVNISGNTKIGDKTIISLRPERVEINPTNSNFENIFQAKIKELIYLGDHIRTRVEVCGYDQFVVKVPNTYKGAEFKEGVTVKLAWKAADSRALNSR